MLLKVSEPVHVSRSDPFFLSLNRPSDSGELDTKKRPISTNGWNPSWGNVRFQSVRSGKPLVARELRNRIFGEQRLPRMTRMVNSVKSARNPGRIQQILYIAHCSRHLIFSRVCDCAWSICCARLRWIPAYVGTKKCCSRRKMKGCGRGVANSF